MATKKKTAHCASKRTAAARIGLVKMWLTTAACDMRRNDRLDALDSLTMAQRALTRARKTILEVQP